MRSDPAHTHTVPRRRMNITLYPINQTSVRLFLKGCDRPSKIQYITWANLDTYGASIYLTKLQHCTYGIFLKLA